MGQQSSLPPAIIKSEMSARLIWAIVSTTLEELAIYLVMTELLPKYDWEAPLWLTIILMAVWLVVSVSIYRAGSRALKNKPVSGLSSMIGVRGVAVKNINPNGLVRIKNELWAATSAEGDISEGEEIIVIDQKKMRLFVKRDV